MRAATFPTARITSAAARWHSSNSAWRKIPLIRTTRRRWPSTRISIDMALPLLQTSCVVLITKADTL
jgi:hypothetical protein